MPERKEFQSFVPLRNYTTLKRTLLNWLLPTCFVPLRNYTTLKHRLPRGAGRSVLYLYEITLLSNGVGCCALVAGVLYLYEITLLSNGVGGCAPVAGVLYLYEITLLSNDASCFSVAQEFCTSTKLHYSQTVQTLPKF